MSSWVTKFVSEMRTKSPVVVQRWVDSIPNDKVTHATDESENFRVTAVSNDTVSKANRESTIELIVSDKELNELNVQSEGDCSAGEREPHRQDEKTHASTNDLETHTTDRRFWNKGPSLLNSLRIRSSTDLLRATETEDLNTTSQLPQSDTPDKIHASTPLSNKSNLNDLYYRLSINKKRYTFIKERKMEAKQLLNNAKSRFLAAANWDDLKDRDTSAPSDDQIESENAAATAVIVNDANDSSGVASVVCDMIDMDLSADEFSRLSQSNDMLSVDDEDSFNVSMPSINDGHTSHLNVSRKIAMADIGRSTSDNPRLRNKFYLADIGRSFSEHQDDEAIIIGERNISAPSSSIAIQNNNRSNGHFFERRAYSVSPTQRGMKRGVLSRDHSLSDGSRHRNQLSKGSSFQSDSSHCSSVESLLDARKPDSEAILRQLGFGPAHQEDLLSRIPKRYTFCICHFAIPFFFTNSR